MPSPAPSQKTPTRNSDAFHIALLVLSAVGFLVLYFKVDLDGSLNATYMAQVSQQVERVERRLMMAEKKMNAMPSKPGMVDDKTMPPASKAVSAVSYLDLKQVSWNGISFLVPNAGIGNEVKAPEKLIFPMIGMNGSYCGGAAPAGCKAGLTVEVEAISGIPRDMALQGTEWKNISEEVLDGAGDPSYVLTAKDGKKFLVKISGSEVFVNEVDGKEQMSEAMFNIEAAKKMVLQSFANN